MATQAQSSSSCSAILTVTVEGSQLDTRAASKEHPDALRTTLITALGLVKLSPSDLTLIRLQEIFRASLESARSKSPHRLSAVVYSCKRGTLEETLWEAQVWRCGGMQLVDAVSSAIGRVSLDGKRSPDSMVLHLSEAGGQPAVTAFHLMNCPANLEEFGRLKGKFFAYGATFALTACAVAISDNVQVIALLETLPLDHLRRLVLHLLYLRPHSDLSYIVQVVFTSKEHSQTKRCRIGPAPRKRKNRDGERAATTTDEDGQPCKNRPRRPLKQHATGMACQRVLPQTSPAALRETPNEPTTVDHFSPSHLHGVGGTSSFQASSKRLDPVGSWSGDGSIRADLDTTDVLPGSDNYLFEYHGIELDSIDFSTPSLPIKVLFVSGSGQDVIEVESGGSLLRDEYDVAGERFAWRGLEATDEWAATPEDEGYLPCGLPERIISNMDDGELDTRVQSSPQFCWPLSSQ
ncbi:pectin degradation [Fusarium denticulatum]|uniref:Pectin degradation n=1 Tax=Fusarium denticulatum TaxID=48507 RepID=A0A8H5UHW9_9HYPO|nr:pectin degradation [Fusarium denticulatum]